MTSRIRASVAAGALALSGSVVLVAGTAAPASAAYGTITTVHGAKLQACRASIDGVAYLRVRLDNRRAGHAHRGGLYRGSSGPKVLEVRAGAGKMSATKKVKIARGSSFSTFVGEIDGPTAGGGFRPSEAPRCGA